MKCFKCEKELKETFTDGNEQPDGGVCVEFRSYYGSRHDIGSERKEHYWQGFLCDDCMDQVMPSLERHPTNEISMNQALRNLFDMLDIREASDDGVEFTPNYISSCRALDGEKMQEALAVLRKHVK